MVIKYKKNLTEDKKVLLMMYFFLIKSKFVVWAVIYFENEYIKKEKNAWSLNYTKNE